MGRIQTSWYLLLIIPAFGLAAENNAGIWDLGEIYPSVEAWAADREAVLRDLEQLEARRGTLGKSADSLYQALSLVSDLTRKAARVSAYASLKADEDLRVNETQERRQLSQIMFARLNEATAWMQPELLRVGEEVINAYIREDARLARFAFQLEDGLRNAPHTLGDEAEQTIAYFTQAFGAPLNIYNVVANSDIPWPTVTLADGEEVVVDSQGYGRLRGGPNRDERKLVFDTFWGKWLEYRNSVGAVLNSHIQTQAALAKARNQTRLAIDLAVRRLSGDATQSANTRRRPAEWAPSEGGGIVGGLSPQSSGNRGATTSPST
jgi:oligoendopeptidase F